MGLDLVGLSLEAAVAVDFCRGRRRLTFFHGAL